MDVKIEYYFKIKNGSSKTFEGEVLHYFVCEPWGSIEDIEAFYRFASFYDSANQVTHHYIFEKKYSQADCEQFVYEMHER